MTGEDIVEKDGEPYWRNTSRGKGGISGQVLTPLTPEEKRLYNSGKKARVGIGCLLSTLISPFILFSLPSRKLYGRHVNQPKEDINEPYNR